jgi:hypothetical protein
MLPIKLVNGLLKITKGLKEIGKDTLGYIEAQENAYFDNFCYQNNI